MGDAAVVPATVFVYDPAPKYLCETTDFIAGSTILAGQVVSFAGTGVSWSVNPCNGVTTAAVVGVALHGAATGAHVAVAGPGSVILVQNGHDTTTAEAGDIVQASPTTALGCVTAETDTTEHYQVGILLEALAASGQAYCLLTPHHYINDGA
jgi:hypothetical protein